MNEYYDDWDYPLFDTEENSHDIETQEFLEGIVEAVYTTADIEMLEHCLEELCCRYEIEVPRGKMKIRRNNV